MASIDTVIYVIRDGDNITRNDRVFDADRIANLKTRWVDGNHLEVRASSAHISQLIMAGSEWARNQNRS